MRPPRRLGLDSDRCAAAPLVLLILFCVAAVDQQLFFTRRFPLGSDYTIYAAAAAALERGEDPYRVDNVARSMEQGDLRYDPVDQANGYLYPPPSLGLFLLLEGLGTHAVSGGAIFLALSLIAAGLAIWLLVRAAYPRAPIGGLDRRGSLMAALCLTSAGMIETLQCGQINALVLLCIAAAWWARVEGRSYLQAALLAAAICL